MTKQSRSVPLRIWVLLGARVGDNNQVLALAEALGLPFEAKPLEYNWLHLIGPRLLGASAASLRAASRAMILHDPSPDFTISTGHRSVAVVRALRRRSGGGTRSIHIGFPRVSLDHFDLVIATPQYPMADHPNLLRVPYALARRRTATPQSGDPAHLNRMPTPRHLLIVGGPTLYWRIDLEALLRTLSAILEDAGKDGGSVLVTTSPRTPAALRDMICRILEESEVPNLLTEPGEEPRYEMLLAGSDSIRVTADSVSMISDAVQTGKPVAIVPIAKSLVGRAIFGVMDLVRPGKRVYPQDLRFFWQALAQAGVSEELAVPKISSSDEMRTVLERVGAIINKLI